MTKETIVAILQAEGLKAQSGAYKLPEDRETQCFVGTGGETMTVARIIRLEAGDEHVCVENARGERFFFDYQAVLGLRITRGEAERAAGFGR